MNNKTILITGGTGGIGKETAIQLAKLGANIIVTGRDRKRGEAAVEEIRRASQNQKVSLLLADLSSKAGIRQLSKDFLAQHSKLDVLINNAGLLEGKRRETVDGIEAHFAVNVLAPYLLTLELLPALKLIPNSRVLNLTGGMPGSHLKVDDLFAEKSFVGLMTYTSAKHAMETMSVEMATRLEKFGIGVFVVFPGTAATSMTGAMTAEFLPMPLKLAAPIFKLMMRPDGGQSAAKAARSSIYAASSSDLAGKTGLYIDTNSRIKAVVAANRDPKNRKIVWDVLEKLSI